MPAQDGTGPLGRGPLTGGGRGNCSGTAARGPVGGFGRGRGYRNRYYATGLPVWARQADTGPAVAASGQGPREEVALLRDQAEALRSRLGDIEERLKQFETE
jgi:hypothetical protein